MSDQPSYMDGVNMKHVYVMSIFISIAIAEFYLHEYMKDKESDINSYDPYKKEWKHLSTKVYHG